jgi:hypothetical protein
VAGRAPVFSRAVALTVCVAAVAGAWSFPSERISFKQGCGRASARGHLIGPHRSELDYIVIAKAGQTLEVELLTDFPEVYYNLLGPRGDEKPIVNTSRTGDRKWSGALSESGEYRVRVYLLRRAARAGTTASFKLRFAMPPTPAAD